MELDLIWSGLFHTSHENQGSIFLAKEFITYAAAFFLALPPPSLQWSHPSEHTQWHTH